MNASIMRKSAADSRAGAPRTRVSGWSRCARWFSALLGGSLSALVFAQTSCPGIHVNISGIRNSTGAVACALFKSAEGFPTRYLRSATHITFIKVRHQQARCNFQDIPPGTYALAVIHDENMNGKLDVNWMKAPKEGYGFSNDAKALLRAPSFPAASFPYDGQNLELTIRLNY